MTPCSTTFPAPCRRCWRPAKLGSRAAKIGFDWPNDRRCSSTKLQEEIAELQAELDCPPRSAVLRTAVEEELGDLLFTAVNLARHLKIDPESALRASNAKFRRRFRAMESAAGGTDRSGGPHTGGAGRSMEPGEERRQRVAKAHERPSQSQHQHRDSPLHDPGTL